MTKLSKRIKQIREAVDPNKFYSLSDALGLAKQNALLSLMSRLI